MERVSERAGKHNARLAMNKKGKEFKMLRGSQGSKDQRTQELGRGAVLEAGEVLMFQGVEGHRYTHPGVR